MPTYEYKCEQCNDRFDHFQSMSSERLRTCRKCGGKLRRLIGEGAGILFKGSGFYCTDYKKSCAKDSDCSDGGSSDKGETKKSCSVS